MSIKLQRQYMNEPRRDDYIIDHSIFWIELLENGECIMDKHHDVSFNGLIPIYISIALAGLGNSNVFPIILSKAMLYMPEKNEVSGLMIMGLFGGTIFPLLMGVMSDALASQIGALIVLSLGIFYLVFLSFNLQKDQVNLAD